MYAMLLAIASIASLLVIAGPTSVLAQNMTNQTMTSANMTNMTASDTSGSSVKMHLEVGIKALENGDKQGAMTHLTAAQQAMSGVSAEAIKHFEAGMKALSDGDSSGALMHLKLADQALG